METRKNNPFPDQERSSSSGEENVRNIRSREENEDTGLVSYEQEEDLEDDELSEADFEVDNLDDENDPEDNY